MQQTKFKLNASQKARKADNKRKLAVYKGMNMNNNINTYNEADAKRSMLLLIAGWTVIVTWIMEQMI